MKNMNYISQKGFVLVVTIIACAILTALGILVFALSNSDLKTSVSTLGEKKALAALDSGFHALTQSFDPQVANFGVNVNNWIEIDPAYDKGSRYRVTGIDATGHSPMPIPGYSMEESQGWRMQVFAMELTGSNTRYRTSLNIDAGVAHGPVDVSNIYR